MELVIFLVILIPLYFFGEWAVRHYDEGKRSSQAIRTESIRVNNNRRLSKTDCYVYLIKVERFKGKPYSSTYLKIGIGVEDRVRLQLKEEGNSLISLYVFRIRDDAFRIEQRVLKAWNNKVLGEITTHNRNLGTEYITYSEKDLEKAKKILGESGGKDVLLEESYKVANQGRQSNQDVNPPAVLNRTLVYLLFNKREKLIKVGMGTFDRPDTLRGKDWEIARFCHFTDRESAKFAESKVLNYWRNDLGMPSPERAKRLLKSGHTETVESSVGITKAWAIITSCPNFIPLVLESEQQILDEYKNLIERGRLIWDDELFWIQIRKSWYGSIESKFYQLSNNVDSQAHIRGDLKQAKSKLRAFGKEFQTFMNKNHAILDRANSMKHWEVSVESVKKLSTNRNPESTRIPRKKDSGNDEISRFWDKVQKSDKCWQWTGAKNPAGYGLAVFEEKVQPAHRVSWKIEYGECASENLLFNNCENKSCVRTSHWELLIRRRSKSEVGNVSVFTCTTPNCGKPSKSVTIAGLCDSCRQKAKRDRRKKREVNGDPAEAPSLDLSKE